MYTCVIVYYITGNVLDCDQSNHSSCIVFSNSPTSKLLLHTAGSGLPSHLN